MKYMGNKQKIADEILTVIFNDSKKTDTFVDLFCGSCSVIERVPDSYIKIANDKNKFLIEMLKSLVNGNEYPKIITKNDYDARRDLYNLSKRHLVLTDEDYAEIGWYGWMASFNGRFFSGGYSGHNVLQKNGKARDYIKEQINNTLRSIPKLKNVNFVSEEYDKVVIPQGSIVYCFDKITEILTNNGWKYLKDCNIEDDKFYSLKPDDHICEWVSASHYINYHYKGKMYHYKSDEIDLMVTPEHNIFCAKEHGRKKDKKDLFVKANEFYGQTKYHFISNVGEWIGNDINTIEINGENYDAKLICYLIGLFITDGSINSKGAITISQKKIDVIQKLQEILNKLNFKYSIYNIKNRGIKIFYFPRQYASFFENFGRLKKIDVFLWFIKIYLLHY